MYYSLHNFHVRSWRRKNIWIRIRNVLCVLGSVASARVQKETELKWTVLVRLLAGKQHTIILNNNYCHDLWKSIFFSRLSESKSILNSFSLQDQAGSLRSSPETNERETGSRNELKNGDLRSVFSEGHFVRHSAYCCRHWNGTSEILFLFSFI